MLNFCCDCMTASVRQDLVISFEVPSKVPQNWEEEVSNKMKRARSKMQWVVPGDMSLSGFGLLVTMQ